MNAARNTGKNLARNLGVDASVLSLPYWRKQRGYTTVSRGLAKG